MFRSALVNCIQQYFASWRRNVLWRSRLGNPTSHDAKYRTVISTVWLIAPSETEPRGCFHCGGHGSKMVKVSNHGWRVMSSSPVPLQTHRVEERCTLNLSRAQRSSRWCGVEARRGSCQLRCRPRHLTMVQNDELRRQKPSCS
ncbi:uncharacterized protein TNCV_2386301 [Trichonephila clavipes]|nr:uncharacterized protein TNCV_2386301 [Trichonephila clavipes]